LELLNDAGPFASIEEAQAAVDAWREEYNHRRPHQSLDMACPASKFQPHPEAGNGLGLWSADSTALLADAAPSRQAD
jgi:transposase InsO family protein